MSVEVIADDDRSFDALRMLAEMSARCTCDTTPIEECPNYVPGDESEVPE